jgi:hypothetical protein
MEGSIFNFSGYEGYMRGRVMKKFVRRNVRKDKTWWGLEVPNIKGRGRK